MPNKRLSFELSLIPFSFALLSPYCFPIPDHPLKLTFKTLEKYVEGNEDHHRRKTFFASADRFIILSPKGITISLKHCLVRIISNSGSIMYTLRASISGGMCWSIDGISWRAIDEIIWKPTIWKRSLVYGNTRDPGCECATTMPFLLLLGVVMAVVVIAVVVVFSCSCYSVHPIHFI